MFQRSFWAALHRWSGPAMAGFLVIVGLTGSVSAFRAELDGRCFTLGANWLIVAVWLETSHHF